MCASDVTETLDLALAASGLDRATVVHRPYGYEEGRLAGSAGL
jgi:hypothetical protein